MARIRFEFRAKAVDIPHKPVEGSHSLVVLRVRAQRPVLLQGVGVVQEGLQRVQRLLVREKPHVVAEDDKRRTFSLVVEEARAPARLREAQRGEVFPQLELPVVRAGPSPVEALQQKPHKVLPLLLLFRR